MTTRSLIADRALQDRGDSSPRTVEGSDEVEFATLEWVAWYNTRRLLELLGHVPPDEFEQAYHNRQTADAELATLT